MTSESFPNGSCFVIIPFFSPHLQIKCDFIAYQYYIELTGTERCYEAIQKLEKKYDVVVNIQGDEPLVEPEIIDGIVKALQVVLLLSYNFHYVFSNSSASTCSYAQ